MKLILIPTSLFFILNLYAQNLVENPGFEAYYDCPNNISFFHKNVKNWSIPNNGTTDYFNACSDQMGFENFTGQQVAKSGEGYAGIHVYFKRNYREYIQGKLKQRLERGKTYDISFYVSLAEKSTHAISNISIQFYADKMVNFTNKNLPETINKPSEQSHNSFLTDSNQWTEIKFTYVAQGFERYFVIGNFDTNKELQKEQLQNRKGKPKAYYYIDDICIAVHTDDKYGNNSKVKKVDGFEKDKIYRLHNILFEFDKATLLEPSLRELDDLSAYLKKHPELNVEVYGHTDNIGLVKRNKELSEQRAKAVADYLILQGLNPSKVLSFGYGSSRPIADNSTEEGRETNRRVEFKLIKH